MHTRRCAMPPSRLLIRDDRYEGIFRRMHVVFPEETILGRYLLPSIWLFCKISCLCSLIGVLVGYRWRRAEWKANGPEHQNPRDIAVQGTNTMVADDKVRLMLLTKPEPHYDHPHILPLHRVQNICRN
jgi:hypothetical protein